MTHLDPYLFFGGNCKEAMEFYKSIFGGTLNVMPFPGSEDRVMHAFLETDGVRLMASDSDNPDFSAKSAISLSLSGDDEVMFKEWFEKLSEGGTVTSPLKVEQWGDTYGQLTDKYGYDWMVNINAKKQWSPFMDATSYIQSELKRLSHFPDIGIPTSHEALVDQLYRIIASHKFRKYSIGEALEAHIRGAIELAIAKQAPINFTFLGGAYKLWRLEEAPEVDFAELFAFMFYTDWLKDLCALHKPGVWFDFYVDDLIVPIINNISMEDVEAYIVSRQKLLDFLKHYQPTNFTMTITRVSDEFASKQAFDEALEHHIVALRKQLGGGLPVLTDSQKATLDLNVKVTPEQASDPQWREKVELIHSAYMNVKREPAYHINPEKIKVFTQPFSDGSAVAVGTTKASIAKFWVGVGALRPRSETFEQLVLSPQQLTKIPFRWENVDCGNLGKNFSRVRIVELKG